MDQRIRVLAALAENFGSVPCNGIDSSFRESETPFWLFQVAGMHLRVDIHAVKTLMHRK